MYDRLLTAAVLQLLLPPAAVPDLAAQVRLLQVLIGRLLALYLNLARPHHRHRQRTMHLQQALAPDGTTEHYRLFDETAKYMDAPPPPAHLMIEAYDP